MTLTRAVALAAATAVTMLVTAACTSHAAGTGSTAGAPDPATTSTSTSTAGASHTASSETGAGATAAPVTGSGANSAGPGSGPGSTPGTSEVAAPTGDGLWHPTIRPQSDTPDVPPLLQNLLGGLSIVAVSTGSTSMMTNYPYTVTVAGSCAAAAAAMARTATSNGMTVVAKGSTTAPSLTGGTVTATWLAITNGPTDGADLSLLAGTAPKTCAVSGVGLTPVLLTMTGPLAGTKAAFAAVTCTAPEPGSIMIGIWAMALDAKRDSTLSLMFTGSGPHGPGKYSTSAGSSKSDNDGDSFYSTKPMYSYAQMVLSAFAAQAKSENSDDDDSGSDSDLPPGAHQLTGTVTMPGGMASGTLDLSGGDEHLTGTFACGASAGG